MERQTTGQMSAKKLHAPISQRVFVVPNPRSAAKSSRNSAVSKVGTFQGQGQQSSSPMKRKHKVTTSSIYDKTRRIELQIASTPAAQASQTLVDKFSAPKESKFTTRVAANRTKVSPMLYSMEGARASVELPSKTYFGSHSTSNKQITIQTPKQVSTSLMPLDPETRHYQLQHGHKTNNQKQTTKINHKCNNSLRNSTPTSVLLDLSKAQVVGKGLNQNLMSNFVHEGVEQPALVVAKEVKTVSNFHKASQNQLSQQIKQRRLGLTGQSTHMNSQQLSSYGGSLTLKTPQAQVSNGLLTIRSSHDQSCTPLSANQRRRAVSRPISFKDLKKIVSDCRETLEKAQNRSSQSFVDQTQSSTERSLPRQRETKSSVSSRTREQKRSLLNSDHMVVQVAMQKMIQSQENYIMSMEALISARVPQSDQRQIEQALLGLEVSLEDFKLSNQETMQLMAKETSTKKVRELRFEEEDNLSVYTISSSEGDCEGGKYDESCIQESTYQHSSNTKQRYTDKLIPKLQLGN